MKKGIYIDNTPLDRALNLWIDELSTLIPLRLSTEYLPVDKLLGRITARPVFAKISSPFYHSSAMDGYAVRFVDTIGASETRPISLIIPEQAVYVDTGDPLPDGFDAVVMIEDTNPSVQNGVKYIEITDPATPWQNVRIIGEDIVSTELILPENYRIRPVDIGAIIASGHETIEVRKRPRIAVIPTGTELVEPGSPLKKGDIIEYNSRMLASMVEEWGGHPIRFAPVPDNIGLLTDIIQKAAELYDMVVVNAGSSAGSEDYTAKVILSLGRVIVHGINIKPGKPVILGEVNSRPVLGIPGYPVSAYITFKLFGQEAVYRLQGLTPPDFDRMEAKLSRQVSSSMGQEEFVRVKLGRVGDNIIATPVSRGAGMLMSLVRADGFLRIPAMSEGYGAGMTVSVEMIRDRKEIENTIVCIGSHDNLLDLLANLLKKKYPFYTLSSAHVGSMGGLIALKKGEAHIAGTHLLDEDTGEYNIPAIRRLLGGRKIILVNLVYRQQGFIVQKGNPKNVTGFDDLVREDITFINRQAGSGTRLLTDKHLNDRSISPTAIKGYDRDEYTHMGVASAVLTGMADTGVGILAAARALGLDFVPVAKERYDIAIPAEYYSMDSISALLDIIRNDMEFRNTVIGLGGYDLSDCGKVIYAS